MKKTTVYCEACHKKLIMRLPNGCLEFVFGKSGVLREFYKSLKGAKGAEYKSILRRLVAAYPELRQHANLDQMVWRDGGKAFQKYIDDEQAPVIMQIYGSVKMVCLRATCNHENTITFLPIADANPVIEHKKTNKRR
jgi:hypothetical protein